MCRRRSRIPNPFSLSYPVVPRPPGDTHPVHSTRAPFRQFTACSVHSYSTCSVQTVLGLNYIMMDPTADDLLTASIGRSPRNDPDPPGSRQADSHGLLLDNATVPASTEARTRHEARPGDLEVKLIPRPWTRWDRRAGGTRGRRYGLEAAAAGTALVSLKDTPQQPAVGKGII